MEELISDTALVASTISTPDRSIHYTAESDELIHLQSHHKGCTAGREFLEFAQLVASKTNHAGAIGDKLQILATMPDRDPGQCYEAASPEYKTAVGSFIDTVVSLLSDISDLHQTKLRQNPIAPEKVIPGIFPRGFAGRASSVVDFQSIVGKMLQKSYEQCEKCDDLLINDRESIRVDSERLENASIAAIENDIARSEAAIEKHSNLSSGKMADIDAALQSEWRGSYRRLMKELGDPLTRNKANNILRSMQETRPGKHTFDFAAWVESARQQTAPSCATYPWPIKVLEFCTSASQHTSSGQSTRDQGHTDNGQESSESEDDDDWC